MTFHLLLLPPIVLLKQNLIFVLALQKIFLFHLNKLQFLIQRQIFLHVLTHKIIKKILILKLYLIFLNKIKYFINILVIIQSFFFQKTIVNLLPFFLNFILLQLKNQKIVY